MPRDEQFCKIFDNNVLANHWLITMVAPEMIARKGGVMVIISSPGGLIGSNVVGAYDVSKAADFQLVRDRAVRAGSHFEPNRRGAKGGVDPRRNVRTRKENATRSG